MRRVAAVAAVVLTAGLAVAASTLDPRGWHVGTPAAGVAEVLGPVSQEPVDVALPESMRRRLTRPTLVVYFSPTCPHCQHVAPELAALAARVADHADVLGVASPSSAAADVRRFRDVYGWTFPVLVDKEGEIGTAMGIQGTPSAMLVRPEPAAEGTPTARLVDLWYPYSPGSDTLVEMRLSPNPWAAFQPGAYQGTTTCAACHTQEAEAWTLSHHAIAWRTLVKDEEQKNPKCVGCHVTGQGQAGGWDGTAATADLVDVQCEACHGPGGPHDGARTDARAACVGCHDAEHSIAFSVEKGLPGIDHFAAVPLDDAGYVAARQALLGGEKPRDLLAFGEGTYVGAAACATCHASEHAQWTSSPHGAAMAPLAGKSSAEDASCVVCHATRTKSGPPSTAVADYRRDEGVGCESCHGPGGAHVAAGGGTTNIVGLGESCPVCVIEAVCTSCHTRAWDPDWDLDRDLPRVGHGPTPSPTAP